MSEEEIKECLDSLYYQDDFCSFSYDKLKDYIINLQEQLQQKENIIKDIKAQLDYLETFSSKEDVFEDMKRRLNRIEKIIKEKK